MPPNPAAASIVITLDGVSSFMPGFLGNTTVETPALDKLAVEGVSFDFAYAPSCELPEILKQMFSTGTGDFVSDTIEGNSLFLSDCPVAIAAAESARFDSIIPVAPNARTRPAESMAESQAADFFAAAIETASTMQQGDLLWLHFSGLKDCWDAPLEMRQSYQGLDDPEPYADVEPPKFLFDAQQDDPDLLVAAQHACFAQVALIDGLLEIFLDNLERMGFGDSVLFILAGVRGYPLGDHGYVDIARTLNAQSLHVPLLVKLPDTEEPMQNRRSHQLVQTSIIGDWLADPTQVQCSCEIIFPADPAPIFFSSPNEVAVEIRGWKLLRKADKDGNTNCSLYVKPDDRWEVNDVAKRCPGIVDDLEKLLAEHLG